MNSIEMQGGQSFNASSGVVTLYVMEIPCSVLCMMSGVDFLYNTLYVKHGTILGTSSCMDEEIPWNTFAVYKRSEKRHAGTLGKYSSTGLGAKEEVSNHSKPALADRETRICVLACMCVPQVHNDDCYERLTRVEGSTYHFYKTVFLCSHCLKLLATGPEMSVYLPRSKFLCVLLSFTLFQIDTVTYLTPVQSQVIRRTFIAQPSTQHVTVACLQKISWLSNT